MATKQKLEELRLACIADLWTFAQVIEPNRVYGDVHKELYKWWTRPDAFDNQLVLLPRDHQKSHCAAVRAAWEITRDPTITILYISATANLAEKQLYDIKNILTSEIYTMLWPEMVNPDEGKREKWSVSEICIDHPLRKNEGVRDSTIKTAGLTTNITGLHCRLAILDDVVVPDNAYTEDGRRNVEAAYSQLASVQTTGAKEIIVGTRYHPSDLYQTIIDMKEDIFNDEGDLVGEKEVYEVFEKVVETGGDFLWPRTMRDDKKAFGFNWKELARKKAKYIDTSQFYAQYYNNPNDPDSMRLDRSKFQYYNQKLLKYENYNWTYNGNKLNVYAAVDFAFSLNKKADYTAIAVIGMDLQGYIYILDLDRFRTNKMEVYFEHILHLHSKYKFRKLRAEVTVAQSTIVEYLKDRAREEGLSLSIDEHRPIKNKEERIAAILEPRYENLTIWHYKGGYCSVLEEELILARPSHDDVKDAVAMAVEIAKAPSKSYKATQQAKIIFHPKFGGIMR